MSEQTPKPQLFTFNSAGWVLVLAGVVTVVVAVVTVLPIVRGIQSRPPGDGADPASYQFALEPAHIPIDRIFPAQHHRDLTRPLVAPAAVAGANVAEVNKAQRGKFLVPSDIVVGVEFGGSARAYPIRLMTAHEIVNDTVGGRPILVTYNPLCGSVLVFDRTVGGQVREFGSSGLVYNSNHLLYDRRPDGSTPPLGGESLWSQIQARAISGPAAADDLELTILPVQLMHWGEWYERHPGTDVMRGDPALKDIYKNTNYASYFRSDELLFPVEPQPEEVAASKTPCLIVRADVTDHLYRVRDVGERADADGLWRHTVDGVDLIFHYRDQPANAWVERADGSTPTVMYMFEFAWNTLDRGES